MAEHKYAQVLRWIADGETVEVKRNRGEWVALPGESANCILKNIADGNCVALSEFRIKPRTVKIGSREVEAPVLEPVEGQKVWYWDNGADEPRDFTYGGKCTAVVDGAAFASAAACMEAQHAIRDYLLEQLK